MLIGFEPEAVTSKNNASSIDALRELGCERIYTAADGVFALDDIIPFLRPGDKLFVADLSRLGTDLDRLIDVVERLHLAGVKLFVAGTEIVPDSKLGDTFGNACSILAQFSRRRRQQDSARRQIKPRGRPLALPPETKARAERMLKVGNMSVVEIAHALDVSPATIYRHFPRTSRAAKYDIDAGRAP